MKPTHIPLTVAAAMWLAAATPDTAAVIHQLPLGTVLCGAERDYVRREDDLARPVPTHTLASSCFFLAEAADARVVGTANPRHVLVVLMGGAHNGAAAWTGRAAMGLAP